jgi:hypothetical protein
MNEKRPIPEVVDEKRDLHQRFLFFFINNLWYVSLFIHPQP